MFFSPSPKWLKDHLLLWLLITIYAWIITAAQFIITKYDENQQVEAFQ